MCVCVFFNSISLDFYGKTIKFGGLNVSLKEDTNIVRYKVQRSGLLYHHGEQKSLGLNATYKALLVLARRGYISFLPKQSLQCAYTQCLMS